MLFDIIFIFQSVFNFISCFLFFSSFFILYIFLLPIGFFNNIVHRAGQFAAIPRPLTADYILSKVNIMFAHFTITKKRRGCVSLGCRKSGIMPLFRGLHGSLVPAARPGNHEKKPLLRKAFADLPHMSPNPIEASGGCGPRTPKGFLTVRKSHDGTFIFDAI